MVSETKLDESFPQRQFKISGFSRLFRPDRNSKGGGSYVICPRRYSS